eukprot:gene3632-4147_t
MASPASQGRRRSQSKPNTEDHALNMIASEAEARLAAKRAARAEARSIRMKELERMQHEADEKMDREYQRSLLTDDAVKAVKQRASINNCFMINQIGSVTHCTTEQRTAYSRLQLLACFISQAGYSIRQSETARVADKIQARIQATTTEVEMNGPVSQEMQIKTLQDNLREMSERFKQAMVSNAQLDNEKQALSYQVDCLKDRLEDAEERIENLKQELLDKSKEFNRLSHDHKNNIEELTKMREQLILRDKLLEEHGIPTDGSEQPDMSQSEFSSSRINDSLHLDSVDFDQSALNKSRDSSRRSSAPDDRESLLEQIKILKEKVSDLRRDPEVDDARLRDAESMQTSGDHIERLPVAGGVLLGDQDLERSETFEDVTDEAIDLHERGYRATGMIVNNNERNEDYDVIEQHLQQGEVSCFEDKSYEASSYTQGSTAGDSMVESFASTVVTESMESERPLEISMNAALDDQVAGEEDANGNEAALDLNVQDAVDAGDGLLLKVGKHPHEKDLNDYDIVESTNDTLIKPADFVADQSSDGDNCAGNISPTTPRYENTGVNDDGDDDIFIANDIVDVASTFSAATVEMMPKESTSLQGGENIEVEMLKPGTVGASDDDGAKVEDLENGDANVEPLPEVDKEVRREEMDEPRNAESAEVEEEAAVIEVNASTDALVLDDALVMESSDLASADIADAELVDDLQHESLSNPSSPEDIQLPEVEAEWVASSKAGGDAAEESVNIDADVATAVNQKDDEDAFLNIEPEEAFFDAKSEISNEFESINEVDITEPVQAQNESNENFEELEVQEADGGLKNEESVEAATGVEDREQPASIGSEEAGQIHASEEDTEQEIQEISGSVDNVLDAEKEDSEVTGVSDDGDVNANESCEEDVNAGSFKDLDKQEEEPEAPGNEVANNMVDIDDADMVHNAEDVSNAAEDDVKESATANSDILPDDIDEVDDKNVGDGALVADNADAVGDGCPETGDHDVAGNKEMPDEDKQTVVEGTGVEGSDDIEKEHLNDHVEAQEGDGKENITTDEEVVIDVTPVLDAEEITAAVEGSSELLIDEPDYPIGDDNVDDKTCFWEVSARSSTGDEQKLPDQVKVEIDDVAGDERKDQPEQETVVASGDQMGQPEQEVHEKEATSPKDKLLEAYETRQKLIASSPDTSRKEASSQPVPKQRKKNKKKKKKGKGVVKVLEHVATATAAVVPDLDDSMQESGNESPVVIGDESLGEEATARGEHDESVESQENTNAEEQAEDSGGGYNSTEQEKRLSIPGARRPSEGSTSGISDAETGLRASKKDSKKSKRESKKDGCKNQ